MDDQYTPIISEEERLARRAARAAARREKQRAYRIRQLRQALPVGAICIVLIGALSAWAVNHHREEKKQNETLPIAASTLPPAPPVLSEKPEPKVFQLNRTASTAVIGEDLPSKHAIVIDVQTGNVLAEKSADTVISPASMTKILTLLVAAENLTEADLDKPFTMTREITDYSYVNGCSVVGLMVDETVPVRELLYGTILSSGADAALGLAQYVAGSHEAFVKMMNKKLKELGASESAHFTNCVGIYDQEHQCTVQDIALILRAAMENELCRKVLDARTYETIPTSDHPDGQVLSNWFLRRIEDKDTGDIDVIGAKTGYVSQSGSCAASCGEDSQGNRFICVTADGYSSWCAIYDHVTLYNRYCNAAPAESSTDLPVDPPAVSAST